MGHAPCIFTTRCTAPVCVAGVAAYLRPQVAPGGLERQPEEHSTVLAALARSQLRAHAAERPALLGVFIHGHQEARLRCCRGIHRAGAVGARGVRLGHGEQRLGHGEQRAARAQKVAAASNVAASNAQTV